MGGKFKRLTAHAAHPVATLTYLNCYSWENMPRSTCEKCFRALGSFQETWMGPLSPMILARLQLCRFLVRLAARTPASGKILAGVSVARCKDAGTASFRQAFLWLAVRTQLPQIFWHAFLWLAAPTELPQSSWQAFP